MVRVVGAVVVGLCLSACSDSVVTGDVGSVGLDTSGGEGDRVVADTSMTDAMLTSDTGSGLDADPGDAVILPSDADTEVVAPECADGGCFGQACAGPEDCDSGYCVPHMGDKICTKPCETECPAGLSCQLASGGSGDPLFLCVSFVPHLCQPCEKSAECDDDGLGAACVSYGDVGMFCGGACSAKSDCPGGYACEEVPTASGGTSKQCVAMSGECTCSKLSKELALSTVCAVTNDLGSCQGKRFCGADGLTACDAEPASEESCDGVDNNCDGLVDEGVDCSDEDQCTVGACSGPDGCSQTVAIGASCDDADPMTQADVCLEDGSCAGVSIACPQGPCIVKGTPNGEDCDMEFHPAGFPCDDGEAATKNDVCDDAGVCAGTSYNCDAEPLSACVVSYTTDGASCVPVFAPDGTLCSDDDAGTKDDVCDGMGTCSGTPYACDGEVTSTCVPSFLPDGNGCLPQLAPEGTPCDDGNPTTTGDACDASGQCEGTSYDCANEPLSACVVSYTTDGASCVPVFAPDGTLCSDDDAGTKDDVCDGMGTCSGTPYACDGEVTSTCVPSFLPDGNGCLPQLAPEGTPCDDQNPSTKDDLCDALGDCAGTSYDCANEPTTTCTPAFETDGQGCVPKHAMGGSICDDGDVNTKDDTCDGAGGCAGTPYDCANEPITNCITAYATDGNGCVPTYAPANTACSDANDTTKDDSCDGAGACKGTPYSCNDPTDPCLPNYVADGVGCQPNYAPPGTPCDDNQLTTYGDVCNGNGSCSGTQCQARTIDFVNLADKVIGSANLWYPNQEETVYLEAPSGRKAWIRIKYSESCNDAYVEMVSPSNHTNMCFDHGKAKCDPVYNMGYFVLSNCDSNIRWKFDGQTKTLGEQANCDSYQAPCDIKGGAGAQLYYGNTSLLPCHDLCKNWTVQAPNCSCTWNGFNVKP